MINPKVCPKYFNGVFRYLQVVEGDIKFLSQVKFIYLPKSTSGKTQRKTMQSSKSTVPSLL